jgi:hypothetical protein
MPLPVCPHMAARCPHKTHICKDNESKDCHYILNALSAAMNVVSSLQAIRYEDLSPNQRVTLNKTQSFLDHYDRKLASFERY